MTSRWLFTGVPPTVASGGSSRAANIFRDAIQKTSGRTVRGGRRGLPATVLYGVRPGTQVAAANLLDRSVMRLMRRSGALRLVDIHDHPVLQPRALGFQLSERRRQHLFSLFQATVEDFELLIAPSKSFAELCVLPPEKTLLVPNGTDCKVIRPQPWPSTKRIAIASGASPGRGLETFLQAFNLLSSEMPDVSLAIALAVTGRDSADYQRRLIDRTRGDPRVSITRVAYASLEQFLGDAQLVAVPHPPGEYMDAALPVKLFDAFAAGRPVLVTPRAETRHLVARVGAGVVSADDSPESLAAGARALLEDQATAQRLGTNARRAAETEFDWRILSARVSQAAGIG